MAEEILVSLINPAGRVVWVAANKVSELTNPDLMPEKRFRVIVNPKETYYPNFDLTRRSNVEIPDSQSFSDTRVMEGTDYQDILKIEVL